MEHSEHANTDGGGEDWRRQALGAQLSLYNSLLPRVHNPVMDSCCYSVYWQQRHTCTEFVIFSVYHGLHVDHSTTNRPASSEAQAVIDSGQQVAKLAQDLGRATSNVTTDQPKVLWSRPIILLGIDLRRSLFFSTPGPGTHKMHARN